MISLMLVPLSTENVPAVSDLEKRAGDVHWSRAQFERELHLPDSRFVVVQVGADILGYGGYWKVADEAQITNLAVRPENRRQGIGWNVLSYLMDRARKEGCIRSLLEVRAGNEAAQAMYRKAGFTAVGRRPRVYENPVEDAVLMEKKL